MPDEGMNVAPPYLVFSVVISFVTFLLFLLRLRGIVNDYRREHSDMTAIRLMVGLLFIVVTLGLLISSLGIPLESPDMAMLGLGIARGALLVTGLTLLVTGYTERPPAAS